jgi:putative NIF3 family GTP cyclohydrolase 1 type 2
MPKVPLPALVTYCDRILRTAETGDYDGAVNGLQVENSGSVTRIAATVDASLATVKLAIAAKADLLIVHHGLFWSKPQPWTGKRHELLRLLVKNNLAIYSSHLPLDAHPKLGNNAQLAAATGTAPKLLPGGKETCERIGIVTGGAGGDLKTAAAAGVDTFITGEGPHWTYALAEELGVNVLYGGHYATETFGVKALAAVLSKKYKLPWVFLDHPTGL